MRNTNLISANIDNIIFQNAKLNFCHLPFNISNTQFINCDLSSTKIFGRYENITLKNCNLFKFVAYYSKFDNLKLINENDKNYSLIFLNSEFKNSTIKTDLFKNEFLACEFKFCQFEAKSYLDTNFFGSSFYEVDFNIKEISGTNFKACGFQNTKIKSLIFGTSFNGSDNEIKYFSHFLDKRLDKRINKSVILKGLNIEKSTILKCTFDPIKDDEAKELREHYKKLEDIYQSKKGNEKKKK
ncbi:MAG: hypothetical protein ABGW99_15530 [Zunongwangia sp.]|uniref:hypothetical protein n=1 Tax=Zunongwangia sp. TaxID=1965325 RepID=UPI0032423635